MTIHLMCVLHNKGSYPIPLQGVTLKLVIPCIYKACFITGHGSCMLWEVVGPGYSLVLCPLLHLYFFKVSLWE